MSYLCPLCEKLLLPHTSGKEYLCENNHHFDLAKEGYLNLLPVQEKRSKDPGDNQQMIRARSSFLEAGFYSPLVRALVEIVDSLKESDQKMKLLDLGCGEGYYSRQIEKLCRNSDQLELHGLDIAKNAIKIAAKKQNNAKFIVASSNKPPYADHYFDLIFKIYAPSNDQQLKRIIKPDGTLLIVTPGPRHLWQLKEFIYEKVNEHSLELELPNGFELVNSQRISYKIIPDQDERMTLLQMTPFAWRADEDCQKRIHEPAELEIETDFVLTLLKSL